MKMIEFTHGVPGSGKSTLAEKLAKTNNGLIFTTDDFYMKDGKYQWAPSFISAAHMWNFSQFARAMFLGAEYLIVANSNLKAWEMMRYVELGASQGFDFKITEPKTKWRYDAEECAKRNSHGVPLATIERMLKDKEDVKAMDAELRRKFYKQEK